MRNTEPRGEDAQTRLIREALEHVMSALQLSHQLMGKVVSFETQLKEHYEVLKDHDEILKGTSGHPGLRTEIALIKQQAANTIETCTRIEKKINTDGQQEEEEKRGVTQAKIAGRSNVTAAIIGVIGLVLGGLVVQFAQWLFGGSANVP